MPRFWKLLLAAGLLTGSAVAMAATPEEVAAAVAEADAVRARVGRDTPEAVKEVSAIFRAARLLAESGELDQARAFYVVGLQLAPQDLPAQLAYAQLLLRMGETDRARFTARHVFRTTESGELREQSGQLLGLKASAPLPLLPERGISQPVVCLVALGKVDSWILELAGRRLEATLQVPVYRYPQDLPLPEPSRDGFTPWLAALKANVKWDAPGVRQAMDELSLKSPNDLSPEQFLDLLEHLHADGIDHTFDRQAWEAQFARAHTSPDQWEVTDVLAALEATCPSRRQVVYIGVTDVDLFSSGRAFQFGSCRPGRPYAVLSYQRFLAAAAGEPDNQERLFNRVHKQLLTLVGESLGVPRPLDPRSARGEVTDLAQLDAKGLWLSPECVRALEKALRHRLPEATREATTRASGIKP